MRNPALLLFLLALPAPALAGPDLDKYRASVVQVFSVAQREDYRRPWQRPSPRGSGGSAFYIGGKRLMTNAHVISNAKRLLVKRADRAKRYEARILFAAHDCDLALITVDDAGFWEGMEPLVIGVRPMIRTTVATVGYPTGGSKISITEGVVSRIELHTYVHDGQANHLTIQTDAAINPGNSGGPVLQDGRVVGVAFQGRFLSQSIGYMIAPSVMRHFLDDIQDGKYDGYSKLGVIWNKLENDSLREFLKVPAGESGVVVLKALPYASCVGALKRNDVLHKIDGIQIENDGTVKVENEFFDFSFIVENKHVGDGVNLTVRRDGKVIDVPVKLKKWGARMQRSHIYDKRPEYLVYGGYVFVPLTSNYLGWRRNEELSFYVQQYYRTVAKEGKTREQLVLLSRVLQHKSNLYRSYSDAIVDKVNGVQPNDFAHFVALIDGSEKNIVKIDFEGVNVAPLILDKKKIKEVHAKILKQRGISEDRYVEERK